ncbi:MAG: hypothetical protein HYW49_04285 [Deltaproteobacteria bacterium]|nr:hypothetical protein [Deltaproteobacteria bacterium]
MRAVDKSKYKVYLDKARQHSEAGDSALKEKGYDAAVTNYCVALINLLDALSVNRFGKDLSSDNHEAAPINMNKRLSGIGIADFKPLSMDCVEILKIKNVASYLSEELTSKDAKRAQEVVGKLKAFVESKVDERVMI